jgi:hypothetical protein
MDISEHQRQILQKLSEKGSENMCFTKEDLIISVYLPEFWNAEFDDESLFYHRTPEYIAAEKAYSASMQSLLDSGLVEVNTCDIHTVRDNEATSVCYRVTAYGRQTLEMLK